jgi:hypothetical protein
VGFAKSTTLDYLDFYGVLDGRNLIFFKKIGQRNQVPSGFRNGDLASAIGLNVISMHFSTRFYHDARE